MNDRLIEDAGCLMEAQSGLGIERFNGKGLRLAKYQAWLETAILPEACRKYSDGTGIIAELVWEASNSIWNLEPSSQESGDIEPLPVGRRRVLLEQLAPLVGGQVVERGC